MILKHLQLTHFKNHENFSLEPGESINCILGKNGTGKTNLLDAIYYLSFTKSAISSQDRNAILHKKASFILFGEYDFGKIALQYLPGKPKTIKIDGVEPDKLSDVIGKVPLVLVLPDDTAMIKDGSEERRKFFDGALSQFDQTYLESLIKYGKLLKQRNSLLKQMDKSSVDPQLIATYDDQLIPFANYISKRRAELVTTFLPFLQKNYRSLHEGSEQPDIQFITHVDENFKVSFHKSFQRDKIMQRTMLGSHRDDYQFLLDNELIKKFGSQGQQKTFIVSLKLALYDFLVEQTGKKPILLLDDIFDKLDDSRITSLVKLLSDDQRFGQVFITDAREERSKKLFEQTDNVTFFAL